MLLVLHIPRPVVAVPFAMLADLEPYPQDAAPNAVLPSISCDEFRKTAKKLGAAPYNLKRTAAYLNCLADNSTVTRPLTDTTWVSKPLRSGSAVINDNIEAMSLDFDVCTPAPVRVSLVQFACLIACSLCTFAKTK